jgi:hypothetical protein
MQKSKLLQIGEKCFLLTLFFIQKMTLWVIDSGNFVDFYSKILFKLEARNGEKTHLG